MTITDVFAAGALLLSFFALGFSIRAYLRSGAHADKLSAFFDQPAIEGFCHWGVGPAGPPECTQPPAFVVRRLVAGELQRRTVCAEHVHSYVHTHGWEVERGN